MRYSTTKFHFILYFFFSVLEKLKEPGQLNKTRIRKKTGYSEKVVAKEGITSYEELVRLLKVKRNIL